MADPGREVFRPAPGQDNDPGRVFYTITADDVGKLVLKTTIGPISLESVIGYVQPGDVGKRLYRVPADDGEHWIWQCESNAQRDRRLARS
jgi:hypothetical protein